MGVMPPAVLPEFALADCTLVMVPDASAAVETGGGEIIRLMPV
jgi:hypothetical protein